MKKVYTKPEIMFESFTLSQSIAGDCDIKTNTPNSGNCPYEVFDGFETSKIFISELTGCDTFEPDDEYDGLCYHTFDGGDTLFNS